MAIGHHFTIIYLHCTILP